MALAPGCISVGVVLMGRGFIWAACWIGIGKADQKQAPFGGLFMLGCLVLKAIKTCMQKNRALMVK